MSPTEELRDQLIHALEGGHAHEKLSRIVGGVPVEARGRLAPGLPHTLWQLLEHLRIAQWDILEYARNPSHVSPEFPQGVWPPAASPPNDAAWEASVAQFLEDGNALLRVVKDPSVDLLAPIAHLDGVSWLRELMLVVSHNAYHLGQFVTTRKALGSW
jgi:DinB superfamily